MSIEQNCNKFLYYHKINKVSDFLVEFLEDQRAIKIQT